MEKHPLHIKNPELQTSPDVNRAVKREERRSKTKNERFLESEAEGPLLREKVPNDPGKRIEAYTDRLENIFLNPDARVRERNLEMFRDKIYADLILSRDNFPESYFELQKRIRRERGQEVAEISPQEREQMIATAINDQRASLDAWIDYLTSPDAVYPAWFKYYAWSQIIKLSQFDKERGEFKKRTASTVAPFPDIYREPLAQIADLYEKVKNDNKHLKEQEIQEQFSKKFPALYAELISKSLAAGMESREEVRGKWVQYHQSESGAAKKLFASLEGKGTGWCTAGQATAESQIESGDFYVFYTNDKDGNPTQPRLAIRMQGNNKIGEVRGVLPNQAVEPVMQETLDEKLAEFGPEADAYKKKSADMKRLTALDQKCVVRNPQTGKIEERLEYHLTKDDLAFLYEIDSSIEGFGYEEDPRIAELRKGRNLEEDMLTIFDCTKEQIAHVPSQINENTLAYVGQLEPGLFQKLPKTLEHIYTSFPEGSLERYQVELGTKTKKEYIAALDVQQIQRSPYANDLLVSKKFYISKNKEQADFLRVTVKDLGFSGGATTEGIYKRAEELGLELCPPEVGPALRLAYPGGDWMLIAMEQISDRDGEPSVFSLRRDDDGLWLGGSAQPTHGWSSSREFVFRLRPSSRA